MNTFSGFASLASLHIPRRSALHQLFAGQRVQQWFSGAGPSDVGWRGRQMGPGAAVAVLHGHVPMDRGLRSQ